MVTLAVDVAVALGGDWGQRVEERQRETTKACVKQEVDVVWS